MKTIFSYIKPYKWYAMLAIVFVIMELSVDLAQPLIIAKIIDDGIVAGNLQSIWTWAFILVGLSFFSLIAGILNSYFSSHTAQSFSFDVRNALFRKIQTFSMNTFSKFPTSSLITRLTSDVTQVQTVIFMSLRIMLKSPLIVIGSLTMAFLVNAKMALFLIVGVPILLLILFLLVKKGIKNFGAVQQRVDFVNRILQESLQAIRLVKAYMRGDYEYTRFEKVATPLKFDTMKALRLMEVIMPAMLVIMNIGLLAAIWVGADQVSSGEAQVGEIVAIINYSMRMTGFFAMFAFFINLYSRAKASSERMEEVLLVQDGIEEIQHGIEDLKDKENLGGTIRFEQVSFVYPNTTKKVLDNITFDVKKGEKLAIMGATGSGKSTLLNLIARFYEPTSGKVYVNNEDVATWDLKSLRAYLGIVPQKSMLFTGSIVENIRWGKQDASLEEVQEATKQAQIHNAIENFPAKYNTRVGQRGVNLSGGQKQRLSIARALVKKAPILILDDSTSALDVKTESALWEALEQSGNYTMLVVTQKVSTAKNAHNILLLDEGKIVGFGNHNELIQSSKLYRQIAKSQGVIVGDQL